MPSPHPDPTTLGTISRLELRAKGVVEGFITGMHRSPFKGFSVEFAQYRGYVPGDDLKHLDWKAYARTERYAIKQYEAETNLVAHLVLDASESMDFASPQAARGPDGVPLTKYAYGQTLAAALSFLILGQSDAVALTVADREILAEVERSTREAHIHRICSTLAGVAPTGTTDLGPVLRQVAMKVRRRGLVVIISDLFTDTDGFISSLRLIAGSGSEIVVMHLLDEEELTFPFEGSVRFIGLEGEGDLRCQPRQIRKAYLEALDQVLNRIRTACRQSRADYVQITTRTPIDVALAAYLNRRVAVALSGRALR